MLLCNRRFLTYHKHKSLCESAKLFYISDKMWVQHCSICSGQKCTCTEHFHIYLCLCYYSLQLSLILKGTVECKGTKFPNIQNAKHRTYITWYLHSGLERRFLSLNFLYKRCHNFWVQCWCKLSASTHSGKIQKVLYSKEFLPARH